MPQQIPKGSGLVNESLQYTTRSSGKEVLTDLIDPPQEDPSSPYSACRISVPGRLAHTVQDVTITLYVTRIPNKSYDYEMANGDRVYRTEARIDPQGEPFDIDVIVRYQGANIKPATISVSSDVNRIIARHQQQ